jgi:Ti-type conjugative transfer relaxase TraA
MAIYHFSAKVISRANGSSAVAAAAYRSASRLHDERLDRAHDFTNKAGVVHSEILHPEGTPERWQDRATLWNEVEAGEVRKDAQLAREVEFAIPREMSQAQGVELARDFVKREFVDHGMVADLNVHWDVGADGGAKPHAHVMLAMREASADGFGPKVRDWNSTELLSHWRQAWADHVNQRLAELDIDSRIDHRTLHDQGIALEPQNKIGAGASGRADRGETAERLAEHRQIARRNGELIIAHPSVGLDAITRQQSTFTDHDLMRFAHRHTDDATQFSQAMSALKTSPDLVRLGQDGAGRDRFSTREMLETERRLETHAERLAGRVGHAVSSGAQARSMAFAEQGGMVLGEGQRDALRHVTGGSDLALVVGYAGSGKSAMLGVAREAWEAQGLRVRGAALSGIAAEGLEGGSAIPSGTLASLEHGWAQGRDALTSGDVLVIDEAGMVGSRQMERVLRAAETAGAKVVLVGDAEQLQAIEAGAAFRALTERHGAAEITEIRRQQVDWQRDATRELATGRTDLALQRYAVSGQLHGHVTRDEARAALVAGWDAARQAQPVASQMMLAHTRAEVAELNGLARGRLRASGDLGPDQQVMTERGERAFATGDRLMFLRNERSLGVKNGTLGEVEAIVGSRLSVRLDGGDGRRVEFDLKDYADIDQGYASTIHKSQGVTVDHAHLLATDGLDRHAAYVGMSRHRVGLEVHYGADDFKDRAELTRVLGRQRAKDTTLDFDAAFAARRGLVPDRDLRRDMAASASGRSRFSTFRPRSVGDQPIPGRDEARPARAPDHTLATRAYARAQADIERMAHDGLPVLPHQRLALARAETQLNAHGPEAAADLRAALSRHRGLASQIDQPGGPEAIGRAVAWEGAVRRDPMLRAERFVHDWTRLKASHSRGGGLDLQRKIEQRLVGLARTLDQDPGLQSVLAGRRAELRLGQVLSHRGLAWELSRSIGRDRGLDLGR